MKMSEEMAVRLHRMMWSDMQKELGDNPDASDRNRYKKKWCETNFPEEDICFNCFLCDYAGHDGSFNSCDKCPIKWPDDRCSSAFGMSKAKVDYRSAPISEILALPVRNKKLTGLEAKYIANDKETVAISYYQYREELLSKASGIPATAAIEDHVKAIREKAVDEYFEKQPAAKLVSMDVDQAFKQYAKEQKEPIFRALAEESGLDPTATLKAHIDAIYSNGFDDGKDAERERILDKIGEMFKK